jgi:arsenite/tail-anchored protein-transporting ATPase
VRILLFTGKGGVGKTTLAAATAVRAASDGLRTLVMSTDAAHSLADAFGSAAPGAFTGAAAEVSPNLYVQQLDAQLRFEQSWSAIQRYLLAVLDKVGVDPIHAEELTVLPGAEEVLSLLEVREQAKSAKWDVLVVDCAPTAETLRLLALPEALTWYMKRVLPAERRIVKALRPVLSRAAGVPMPSDSVFDALERLHGELADAREVLTGSTTTVRLVLTPENIVVAEARRMLTSLSLYGYRVDGVVANRVFPSADADPWRAGWVAAQSEVLAEIEDSFASVPVWRSSYREREPVGNAELAALAGELYGMADPLAVTGVEPPLEIIRAAGETRLSLALPFVETADVDLARHGDELVITVGSHRRLLSLPAGLQGCSIAAARLLHGRLMLRFVAAEPEAALAAGVAR